MFPAQPGQHDVPHPGGRPRARVRGRPRPSQHADDQEQHDDPRMWDGAPRRPDVSSVPSSGRTRREYETFHRTGPGLSSAGLVTALLPFGPAVGPAPPTQGYPGPRIVPTPGRSLASRPVSAHPRPGDDRLPAPRGVAPRRQPEDWNRSPSAQSVSPKRLEQSPSSSRIMCLAFSSADQTLDWYFRDQWVSYRETPRGVDVLAVGLEEIGPLMQSGLGQEDLLGIRTRQI